MRSILVRLLLSFFLTILLSALVSGLVMFSFSRRSVESFRHDFLRQLHASIARSVVLMGQAAYVMHQYRDAGVLAAYVEEVRTTMHTQLFLVVEGHFLPRDAHPAPDVDLAGLVAMAGKEGEPYLRDTGRELIVAQRLLAPEGVSYVVIGLHRFMPPPGPGSGAPTPGPRPDGSPPDHGSFVSMFRNGPELQTLVLLVIAGIVCFLLARSFSVPLTRLREVSRRIADGDLTARVGSSVAGPANEIDGLARDFDHMAERMEGLVNSQKRLLLDISHELRSPLARLDLALELARKRFQTNNDGNLERIARESARLNHLISQLLTLAKLESCRGEGEADQVHLADLVLEIGDDAQFEAENVNKEIRIADLEDLVVTGSRELLRQAIDNIVRNGIRHTLPGSQVEIALFSCRKDHTARPTAVLRVRDHGPGVPAEMLPHLVEPFFRVAEARDRISGGTGLGLAIAHQAVLRHGGTLVLTNAPAGDGLIVEIRLALAPAPPEGTAGLQGP